MAHLSGIHVRRHLRSLTAALLLGTAIVGLSDVILGPTISRALGRARRLLTYPGRAGRWPLALGALLLVASTASVVGTANSAPVFTSLALSKSVLNEGESVTLTGAFNDPDPNQRHTLIVYWYGGEGEELQQLKQKIQLPAGQSTFQVSHVYADNFSAQPLKVVIFDHDLPDGANDNTGGLAGDTEFLPITVKNVAPRLPGPNTVTSSRVSATRVVVKIDGPIADAVRDTHQVRVAKWYGSTPAKVTTPCTAANLRFHCELTYSSRELGSDQAVTVYVKDDEGADGAANITVPLGDASGA